MRMKCFALLFGTILFLGGCGLKNTSEPGRDLPEEQQQESKTVDIAATEVRDDEKEPTESTTSNEPDILVFRDVFGEEYEVVINPNVKKKEYKDELFFHDGDRLTYKDDAYDVRLGIDVSHHQGYIDWDSVKSAGYDFAFLRIGYRGYGQAGNICKDREFDRNIVNAQKAGIKVGVYFFAQAINEHEAMEEASSVIDWLDGYEIDLPVVYDPESIMDDEARTDDVTGEQFTKNTKRFCEMITEAGYQPMIYANMLWEAYELDLEELGAYPIWYADYEALPQTPYHFRFWQYYNEGRVPGVQGDCDLNIWIEKR